MRRLASGDPFLSGPLAAARRVRRLGAAFLRVVLALVVLRLRVVVFARRLRVVFVAGLANIMATAPVACPWAILGTARTRIFILIPCDVSSFRVSSLPDPLPGLARLADISIPAQSVLIWRRRGPACACAGPSISLDGPMLL